MEFLVATENDFQASTSQHCYNFPEGQASKLVFFAPRSLLVSMNHSQFFQQDPCDMQCWSFDGSTMYLLNIMQVILFWSKMFDVKISILPMDLYHFYFSLSASLFSFSFDLSLLSDSVFWRLDSGSGSLAVSLFFLFVSAAASFLPFCSFLNTWKHWKTNRLRRI